MNRHWGVVVAVGTLSLSLLVSLAMMSDATQNSDQFGRSYWLLLIINVVGLTTYIVLIGMKIQQLIGDLRHKRPGARLTLRMLTMFVALSVLPMLVVYSFSLDFLKRGIDSWFDVRIEQALADSLELGRNALDQRMRELLKQTEVLASELSEGPANLAALDLKQLQAPSASEITSALPVNLDDLRGRAGADELLLLSRQGRILATSSSVHDIVPNLPGEEILLQLGQGGSYIGLDLIRDTVLAVRVVVNVPGIGTDARMLQAIYPIPARISKLANNVQSTYTQYKELAYLRAQLMSSFTMTLTLALFLSIFTAVWAAFYSANRMTAPIRDLAEGTHAVARGDYHYALPVTSQDELGFLVESFNEMTRQIARARDEARESRDQVDAQRAYLQAVLGRLSSGVLTLNKRHALRTANASADKVLGIELQPLIGYSLKTICTKYPHLQPFQDVVQTALNERATDWNQQIALFGSGGRRILMCRGTSLSGGGQTGHIIVFDDITALLQGQRDAAWSEVARRLAHEIKNPLTPIQLAAERLRHKYLSALPGTDVELLDRLTHTIIQQVETMKGMVNTFSDYARTPQSQIQRINVNSLVEEVADLFRNVDREAVFEIRLDPDIPAIDADPSRMRQVLNNLIKNAFEATEGCAKRKIVITSRMAHQAGHSYAELRIEDNGPGISEKMLTQIFEPYFTNKAKGTGLGLAIVKKIVEEHSGVVWVENNATGGACAVIRLPIGVAEIITERRRQEHRNAI
jgi:nitrogen fixation/metabolism regulation signal transduction histidine kinase